MSNDDCMNHINNLIMHNNDYAAKVVELEQIITNLNEQNKILSERNIILKSHVEELMEDNSNKQNVINTLHYQINNLHIKLNMYH
jgi:hypothetical protein